MLKSRSKLHTHDDGKRDRERDGVRCSVLVGDDIPHFGTPPFGTMTHTRSRNGLAQIGLATIGLLVKHGLAKIEFAKIANQVGQKAQLRKTTPNHNRQY